MVDSFLRGIVLRKYIQRFGSTDELNGFRQLNWSSNFIQEHFTPTNIVCHVLIHIKAHAVIPLLRLTLMELPFALPNSYITTFFCLVAAEK
jgi:hypothetical protein